jgi:hypothetical protein
MVSIGEIIATATAFNESLFSKSFSASTTAINSLIDKRCTLVASPPPFAFYSLGIAVEPRLLRITL